MKTRTFVVKRGGWALLGILATAGVIGGCASQGKVDDANDTIRSLTDSNQALQQELDQTNSEIALLRGQYDQSSGTAGDLRTANAALRAQLGTAQQDLLAFEDRLRNTKLGDLDPQTAAALEALARQYPDLVQYDAQRGMLRFASDLTFDKGSVVVKDQAMAGLTALANILKTGTATSYEIHIVGHTDSQRISAATAQRHPTNAHLSCHRAIAVRNALATLGVVPAKMMAAGWGAQRPVVTNAATGGTPANRRVEIYLTASTLGTAALPAPQGGQIDPDQAAPPERQPEPMK